MNKVTILFISLFTLAGNSFEVVKIMTQLQFKKFESEKVYAGNTHDLRDGFIHMPKRGQVERVVKKYFPERPVFLVIFQESTFGENLVYEAASNGDLYPHVYNEALNWTGISEILVIVK